MIIDHHNREYSGGIPLALGDRYHGQDNFRDFDYLLDRAGLIGQDILQQQAKLIISGGVISAGATPANEIDISALVGYIKFEVTVPNTFAAIPPSTVQEDIEFIRTALAAQNDIVVNGGGNLSATLDGSTNYIKVKYAEADGNTRTRAKKAGSYAYEQAPSSVLTIDTDAPTDKEIVLGELAGNGAVDLTITIASRSFTLGLVRNVSIKELVANYTILDNEGYSVFRVTTGGSDRTITLPTAADNKNREITIEKADSETDKLIIDGEGSEKIEDELTVELTRKYSKLKVRSNGTSWDILQLYYKPYTSGWISRSDWTSIDMGTMLVNYNNLAGTFQVGEIVTEATSGNTGIVTFDTGTALFLEQITGTGFFTHTRQLTGADSGATADVNGNTKNADSDISHYFEVGSGDLQLHLFISANAAFDATTIEISSSLVLEGATFYGYTIHQIDANKQVAPTQVSGLAYGSQVFNTIAIDTQDWFYQWVAYRRKG